MSDDEFATKCFWKTGKDNESSPPRIQGVGLFNKRASNESADNKLSPLMKKIKVDDVKMENQDGTSVKKEPNQRYISNFIDLTNSDSSQEDLGKECISLLNAKVDPSIVKAFISPVKVINNPAILPTPTKGAQTEMMIGGINVKFPCKPYKSQISVINSVSQKLFPTRSIFLVLDERNDFFPRLLEEQQEKNIVYWRVQLEVAKLWHYCAVLLHGNMRFKVSLIFGFKKFIKIIYLDSEINFS